MKRHLYTILLPVAAALALSGCTTGSEEADEHYIKLSDAVCTFTEDGGEAQIIEVRANPEWSFESGASWLKVSAGEGSTLEVSVDPNADGERNAEITLQAGEATASIRVYQLGARGLSARYRLLEQLNSAVMSPSGRYVGGFYTDVLGENGFQYTAVVIDLETDKWHEFGPYPETLFGFTEAEVVTDQGVLYISDSTNGGCVAFDLDGTYTVPKSIAGYGPLVMQSSSVDGSVMVGYTEGTPYGCMYGPVKVVDGEVKPLPLPEEGNFRNEEWWAGILARGMSADGSVVYGTSWENYDYGMAYWDKDGNVDWVGSDLRTVTTVQRPNPLDGTLYDYNIVNGMICWANQTQISPNGKWIAGAYRYEIMEDGNYHIETYPAVLNTETGKTVIIKDYGERVVSHITNDGIVCIANSSYLPNNGFMYDVNTQTNLGSVQGWLLSTYGIIAPMGYIRHVSPDGQYLMAHTMEDSALQPRVVGWYLAPALEK